MKITHTPDDENRKVELNTTEARQARTGHNVRYVLLFSILGVAVAFAIILMVFSWGS